MFRLILLFIIFLVLQSTTTKAQTKSFEFSGSVVNSQNNQGLNGASISLPDLRLGTIANNKGQFNIKNIPGGAHLVEISFAGFASIIVIVDFSSNMQQQYFLKHTVAEHNEVIVTGVSAATSLRKVTTPVAVIRKQELLQTGSLNIIDALTKKPGINQASTGPAISKPIIRGLGFNRIVVVNDGLRQEGQQWGDEHGIEIDEHSVQKAEMLKGPASLIYGSDAIAGVVNFISNTPVAEGKITTNLFCNYHTNNRLRSLSGNVAGNKKGFLFRLYTSMKDAADYYNPKDKYVFNSKFNERNAGAIIGLSKKWGYSHLVFSSFNQNLGLVEGSRNSDGYFIKYANTALQTVATSKDFLSTNPYIPYQHITHNKLVSDNGIFLKGGKLTLNVGVQHNQRREFGNIEDSKVKSVWLNLKTINYSLQYHLKQHNDWKFTFGESGMYQKNINQGQEAVIADYFLADFGAFALAQKKWNRFNFSGGLRYDHRLVKSKERTEALEVKFESFSRNFSNLSASAGFTFEFSKSKLLRVNIARGFRAPNMAELSSNGAHEGTNRYEVGNKNLNSETSLQADAGFELNAEHISIAASIFYNKINHFIFFEKFPSAIGTDSVINVNGEELYVFRFVQQPSHLFGMEFSLDIHPHPLDWLHFENSFSFVRGQFLNKALENKNMPFIPAARLVSELRFDLFLRSNKLLQNAYFKAEVDNNFAQNKAYTSYNTETKTRHYRLINVGVGGDVLYKGKNVAAIYLYVSNLTNVAYQHHLSRLKYAGQNPRTNQTGVYNMGRNFSLKLNIPLVYSWK